MANSGSNDGAITVTDAPTSRTNLGLGTMAVVGTPIPVANGGTGQASFTANATLVTTSTTSVGTIGPGTDGQIIIGSTAGTPIWASPTSSNGSVTFTTGANVLTIGITQATTSQTGGSSIATSAEGITGTNNTKVIVPSACTAVFGSPPAIGATTPAAGNFSTLTLTTTTGPTVTTGSGAPGGSAPLGSIYFRTNGTTTITRAYVNTNGSTTWTPLITVA